jgi:hypothetical protein
MHPAEASGEMPFLRLDAGTAVRSLKRRLAAIRVATEIDWLDPAPRLKRTQAAIPA